MSSKFQSSKFQVEDRPRFVFNLELGTLELGTLISNYKEKTMLGAQGITSGVSISAPLAAKAGATVQGKADARLKDMAGEMEATFLSMLLKEMRQTLDSESEGGGLFPGDSGDVQGGLFDLYLGRHMAEAGGVGMATALVRQMQEASGATAKTEHQRDAHQPTAIDPGRITPSAATR